MAIKCIIVDDEPIAIEIIKNHLDRLQNIEIIAKCKNAVEAFDILRNKNIDLMFLDIKMPQLTGIEFLKSLANPPAVIITTAYRNYAIDGFELNAIDYLLKPISFERFVKAIDKYYSLKANKNIKFKSDETSLSDDFIYVKSGNEIHKIYIKDITHIESYKDQITIHLNSGFIRAYFKIGEIEQQLPDNLFIRVHKSFIISKKYIKSFSPRYIKVGSEEIPIGITYRDSVIKQLELEV